MKTVSGEKKISIKYRITKPITKIRETVIIDFFFLFSIAHTVTQIHLCCTHKSAMRMMHLKHQQKQTIEGETIEAKTIKGANFISI